MSTLQRFKVVMHDEDAPALTLGTVAVDEQGQLSILDTALAEDDRLQTVVDELNAEQALHQEAAPPPGAPRFGVYTRPVARGTPGFLAALREHLRRYHDIELQDA
ncbi:hypothetical protein KAK06_08220 [Ideonella sp. 4Y11]|uniref:Uncharacterized protein n=1 Tax=Ideonella aquatica TaxID=2824119 RepID=A0A940YN26_9BURK|nr:hypothetical protein [Ideonella aquatica]MBQ0958943.1 hypothetical protein [Ideonella aquatica]